MTITREHLELAALAAGMTYRDDLWDGGHVQHVDGLWHPWRPHLDDGESRRLQIASRIHLEVFLSAARAMALGGRFVTVEHDGTQTDAARAARWAVVLAAAAVGERMRGGGA